ncbi:polysaccharide pyruvyl transferase family protein [Butyrivibrio sp. NC3005]|uniref:polysaccharide pyruvyl transferase family protein n=1 Tax=Butyrivibrio sp. NC3005 TaxID=1280685 RepID=UPI00040C4910|nr:polysaccharide pyruvyl transferase family protein [Butyrivibrio sp. NC3005]
MYKQYKDVAPCVKGVDCAFWTVDVFDPRGFADSDYDVVTFNRSEEPEIFKDANNVVRPWHMQYQYRKEYSNETILISDTPYDYLTVYANARTVYTDLVHATIVSLMYGTPVKYWENGKRYKCFYALENLEKTNDILKVSEESLYIQKNRIVDEAKNIIRIK